MQVCSLGSGSRGNATLIYVADQRLLVDCGFGLKETISRLESVGCSPNQLDALLVTHEHADHAAGVESLAAKFDIPVYMTSGTSDAWRSRGRVAARVIRAGQEFSIGEADILPVAVPHDAREPVQFIFRSGSIKFGLLTDLGSLTPHVVAAYSDCTALFIEANHDRKMLEDGPYPAALKSRVGGAWGHLSNLQAAELIKQINENNSLKKLIVGHISQQNNALDKVADVLEPVSRDLDQVVYATQDTPLSWVDVS